MPLVIAGLRLDLEQLSEAKGVVLIAITLPAVLLPKGDWCLSFTNPYLIAAIVTTGAGILTRNLLATIAVGLCAFFIYRIFLFG
jgi:branched-subunit amino acid transport protein